nr:GNAT family protein [Sphingomonas liriopis]
MRTPRLTLRARVVDDADALFDTMADADAMRWWSRAPVGSVGELRAHFAEAHPGWRAWAAVHEGRAVGFVSAGEKRQGGVSEIGYLFARDTWGTGLAREAVAAVIAQLFAEGQRRVFADTDPDNAGSIRLLERLGFTLEGRLRAEWHTHIGVRDSLIYGLLREEWRGS